MAYSQSKKLTDTEKKLEALKTQLFGKEKNVGYTKNDLTTTKGEVKQAAFSQSAFQKTEIQDVNYLRRDLQKIFILASIAIGAQLILYMQFTFSSSGRLPFG